MSDPVISDAGPLIGFARAELLEILRSLYGRILIPPAVFSELRTTEDRPGERALRAPHRAGWLIEEPVSRSRELAALEKIVDRGEAEAISLALGRRHRFVLVDDRRARAMARRRGLVVVGTGGVLVAAKRRELIDAVAPALDRLARVGYRLSPALRTEIARLAGE